MNQELERFEPVEATGRIVYEHLHRYAVCREHVAGKRVLDIGCGAGYGTHLLAEQAAEAIGVDIDAEAIERARKSYRRANLSYDVADCYGLPFSDGEFDAIVANEMIEHIDRQADFLREAKRVLKPGGLFIVSTPNRPVYNRYKSPNPFHVAEMDIVEFRDLLEEQFEVVKLTGLRMALVSAAFEMEADRRPVNLAAATTYKGEKSASGRPEIRNEEISLADPEYVLAFCADQAIEETPHSSIYFSQDDDLWLEHEQIMAWASQLHSEDEVLRADLRNMQSELENERRTSDGRQHLALSSRLLGRLAGEPVDADPIAVIDAMFVLNERMTRQNLRLETLEGIDRKARSLENELTESRQQFHRARQSLSESQEQLGRRSEDNARLSSQVDELGASLKATREELATAEAIRTQLEEQRAQAEAERAQQGEQRKRAEDDNRRLKKRVAELEALAAATKSTDVSVNEAQAGTRERQRARLESSLSSVRKQIEGASEGVRGRISQSEKPKRSFVARFRHSPAKSWLRLFDRDWVTRQLGDERGRNMTMARLLSDPELYSTDPHPLFSATRYLTQNPDVAAQGMSPVSHYLEFGWREGRNPHPYFCNDWYLARNPDVAYQGVNPLLHYLEHGWKEGRMPNPVFDPQAYLGRNPDVQREGIEPLTHYVMFGADEDREIPFAGLERDWRTLIGDKDADSLMDYLLSPAGSESPPGPHSFRHVISRSNETWPPIPVSDFWIPQALRDFLTESRWEKWIPLYTYLYSVMDLYAENMDGFESSETCTTILNRIIALAGETSRSGIATPKASIVIPVFNNILDTLLCVLSVLEVNPEVSFEIIIADDGSTDSTEQLIGQIGGNVRYIRQPRNLGFLENCNAAAELARGQVLVLLNNDTLALPEWLDRLIAPFDHLDRVGLVGSKLLSWDGRLQEAGGILWEDGSAWNFGRGQNAMDPEFNYLKDVDYISGASIAVPSLTWRELDGFDSLYKPAYCEDSDLAFRLRQAGLRILYNPASQLIHHEGRSHGRDTDGGIKAYQVANQRRFSDRWRTTLANDHLPNGSDVLRARDRSRNKPHILVIDHYVPQIDKDAGSRTMFQFLQSLVDAGWAVTFWPENLHLDPDYTPRVQALGVEVIYGTRYVDRFSDFLRSRHGLYDAVLLSRPHVASRFIDDVRTLTNARILYYGHDVHFERMKAQRDVANTVDDDAVEAMKNLEVGLCNRCDIILYPAEDEARLMRKLVSPKVQSLAVPAYCFSEDQLTRSARGIEPRIGGRSRLLFVGGFSHGPNVDGIVWFCREVAPILRSHGCEFELQVVGSNPTSDVWDLEDHDIHILGFVSDEKLRECYAEASLVIAPLRFGAGVKGKVVEAMANGVPVVTTTVGAQGLSNASDYLFIGDSADEFAAAVQAGLEPDSGLKKAGLALDYVRTNYSVEAMRNVLTSVLPSGSTAVRAA